MMREKYICVGGIVHAFDPYYSNFLIEEACKCHVWILKFLSHSHGILLRKIIEDFLTMKFIQFVSRFDQSHLL